MSDKRNNFKAITETKAPKLRCFSTASSPFNSFPYRPPPPLLSLSPAFLSVNGVWGLWSAWSQCSVSCEDGIQTRTRLCDHPPRLHGGRDCEGENIQTKNCTLDECPGELASAPFVLSLSEEVYVQYKK